MLIVGCGQSRTLNAQAPEFVRLDGSTVLGTEQAQKMDVFSYAMVLWELMSRQRPSRGYARCRQTGRPDLVPHWVCGVSRLIAEPQRAISWC